MILDECVIIKWNPSNKKHYESKGYKFTNYNDEFKCLVKDISEGSHVNVLVSCDYCGKSKKHIPYNRYYKKILSTNLPKYSCGNCRKLKLNELRVINGTDKFIRKIDFDTVKKAFEKLDYILLSTEDDYKNTNSKLKYLCKIHGEQLGTYSNIKNEHGCKFCGFDKTRKKNSLSFKEVKQLFKSKNLILLETEYINCETKMKYRCKKHKDIIQEINVHNLKQNSGCRYCSNEKLAESFKLDYEYVKDLFKSCNHELIDNIYINNNTPLKYKCLKHPNIIQETTLISLAKHKNSCYYCKCEKLQGEKHYAWKGGISNLIDFLRSCIYQWKLDSMKVFNYKCVLSNQPFDIIHHLYSFNDIVKELLEITRLPVYKTMNNYSDEEIDLLKDTCLKLHYKYGLGVPLTNDIHKLFHSLYGNNNTPDQFEEFKIRYRMGEFNSIA